MESIDQHFELGVYKDIGELFITGAILFVGMLLYISWPIATVQLIYGAFKLWRGDLKKGKGMIAGAISTFVIYFLIVTLIVLGADVSFGP